MIWRLWLVYMVLTALALFGLGVAVEALTEARMAGLLMVAGGLMWLLAGAVALWISRLMLRPLENIRRGAERFGRGDLSVRIEAPEAAELARLATALNIMAEQLGERIAEITRQRNEREAILASMQEALIAIDSEERILGLNRAAEEIFGVPEHSVRGRLVQESFRDSELLRYIAEALRGKHPGEEEGGALLRARAGLVLQANCAPLRDAEGKEIGLLILLEDVTRLNRLENLRRDFAANVSHELRTPAAGIKGYAETLLDGALDDSVTARRFVETIYRQTDRLNDLIEDLLSLSRLENMEDIHRAPTTVREILQGAIDICQHLAEERGARVELDCPPDLNADINGRLLEQAMVNLIDNAIKYGGNPAEVSIRAETEGGDLLLSVSDKGPGIPAEHHERLFERFYRVDKARSRAIGGTGLGLSIVKHVAQAHGGTVAINSRLGHGSSFVIRLPKAVKAEAV